MQDADDEQSPHNHNNNNNRGHQRQPSSSDIPASAVQPMNNNVILNNMSNMNNNDVQSSGIGKYPIYLYTFLLSLLPFITLSLSVHFCSIYIYLVYTKEKTFTEHAGPIWSLKVSDFYLFSGSSDKSIKVKTNKR